MCNALLPYLVCFLNLCYVMESFHQLVLTLFSMGINLFSIFVVLWEVFINWSLPYLAWALIYFQSLLCYEKFSLIGPYLI